MFPPKTRGKKWGLSWFEPFWTNRNDMYSKYEMPWVWFQVINPRRWFQARTKILVRIDTYRLNTFDPMGIANEYVSSFGNSVVHAVFRTWYIRSCRPRALLIPPVSLDLTSFISCSNAGGCPLAGFTLESGYIPYHGSLKIHRMTMVLRDMGPHRCWLSYWFFDLAIALR